MSRVARRTRSGRRRSTAARSAARRYAEYALTLAIFLAIAVAASRFGVIESRQMEGRAVVNDGDTLTLAGERIRLRGIDAPEFGQSCERAGVRYDCGREASRALRSLVAGRDIACEGWERDQYDRLLATCRAGGVDIAQRLVETGLAVSYGSYGAEEARARRDGVGLWAGGFERPRDWREQHGGLAEGEHGLVSLLANWWRALFGQG